MSKQGILKALALSALLAGASASADPDPGDAGAAARTPDRALGLAIAAQGDAALREIRAAARRAVTDSLRLPELTPPAIEVASAALADAGRGERPRGGEKP